MLLSPGFLYTPPEPRRRHPLVATRIDGERSEAARRLCRSMWSQCRIFVLPQQGRRHSKQVAAPHASSCHCAQNRQAMSQRESHPIGEDWVDPVFGPVRRIPKPTPWQMKREEDTRLFTDDDLATFDGWLRYQGFDAATLAPEELENWRSLFDEARESAAATPRVGLMKLPPLARGEHRYAVAVREGSDLWLTLWVRRSPKPEFFVFMPRGDRGWNPHASYHLDGTLHQKSFDHKFGSQKRQPLTSVFRGTEHLGAYMGHSPKAVGAICDPSASLGLSKLRLSYWGRAMVKL
jgi:hypothetical protein